MRIEIEIDAHKGVIINGYICPTMLRIIFTAITGVVSFPILVQLGRALGWM